MTGKKTLPLTYDPFFKCIFNPETHPERLESLLSSIIGQKVTIQLILPSENVVLSSDSLLIMDLIVRLADGSLANIEIQKIPYRFPAERMSCYSSDLLLRQYASLKSKDGFTYSDMKKVYTIILFEKSSGIFHDKALEGAFLHHGKTTFDTGLPLELLQEYFLIALDVFRESDYTNCNSNLTMWLSLLVTESVRDAEALIKKFPELEEIYGEMSGYMCRKEEILTMFSEALRILDRNTVRFMIEEMQKDVDDKESALVELKSELTGINAELSNTMAKLSDTKSELSDTRIQLSDTQIRLEKAEYDAIYNAVILMRKYSASREDAITEVVSRFGKTKDEAEKIVEKYW